MANINALIGFVIFVLLLTSFAPAFYNSTYTGACDIGSANLTNCALENITTSAKAGFSIMDIIYPILGVLGGLAVMGIKIQKGRS